LVKFCQYLTPSANTEFENMSAQRTKTNRNRMAISLQLNQYSDAQPARVRAPLAPDDSMAFPAMRGRFSPGISYDTDRTMASPFLPAYRMSVRTHAPKWRS
jgi:hypothetical protein